MQHVYWYSGVISTRGYEKLCDSLKKCASHPPILVIGTPGGDPDAGFRIARALQHVGDGQGFVAMVPRYCKSAGTLVLLGAKALYLADKSELGPLDIQIKKSDELLGQNSGLDIMQAVDFLRDQAATAFRGYMLEFVRLGLSTRVSADMAVKLASAFLDPIAAQIDPLRLAENQRATAITWAYGERLADVGNNLHPGALENLIFSYPSHGFVIDRKEARRSFKLVQSPDTELLKMCYSFESEVGQHTMDHDPVVQCHELSQPIALKESKDATEGQLPTDGAARGTTESSAGLNGALQEDRPSS